MPTKLAEERIKAWEDQKGYINARHADWFNNIAFYLGYHYQIWDSDIYSFFVPPLEDENQTITYADNLIQSLVETRVSKLIANKSVLNVVSKDGSAKSIEQAERETDILRAIWYDCNIPTLLIRTALWAVVNNRCFLRPYWDFKRNRAEIDRIDGFQMLHDETQNSWDRVRSRGWVDIKSIQSKESLIGTFPEKKKIIESLTEVTQAGVCSVQDKVMQLEDRASKEQRMAQYRNQEGKKAGVETIEHYLAPTNKEKDGMYAVIAGGEEIYRNRLPKGSNGKIQVVDFTDMLGLTTSWSRSLVSRSRQGQKVYNHWYSKIIELGSMPPLYLLPKDSGINEEDLIERACLVLEYEFEESKPQIVPPPSVPEVWILILTLIRNSIEHLWGTHEVTARATTPGGKDMSGRGIALLQKEDTGRLASPMIRWNDSQQDLGDILLGLYRENSTYKQTMYYPVAGGGTRPITFTKSDITDKNSVYLEVGTDYSRNKEATFKLVTAFLGLLKNLPRTAQSLDTPSQMHKLMSFADPSVANVFIYKNKPIQQAEDENRIMLDPKLPIPKVEPYHVHETHLMVLRELMCSREFRQLPHRRQMEIKYMHLFAHMHYAGIKLPPEYKAQMPSEPTQIVGEPGQQVFEQSTGEPTSELTEIDRSAEAEASEFAGPQEEGF